MVSPLFFNIPWHRHTTVTGCPTMTNITSQFPLKCHYWPIFCSCLPLFTPWIPNFHILKISNMLSSHFPKGLKCPRYNQGINTDQVHVISVERRPPPSGEWKAHCTYNTPLSITIRSFQLPRSGNDWLEDASYYIGIIMFKSSKFDCIC